MSGFTEIRVLGGSELAESTAGLVEILLDCVHEGSSLGFLLKLDSSGAREFWNSVLLKSDAGELIVLGAFIEGALAGTVTLKFSLPPNQPHKADISKLLVSPNFRRRGIATALMDAVEELALEFDRDLLVLDTLSGTPAEEFYFGCGWKKVGEIPRFALLPKGGEPLPTSVFYKDLLTEES